MDTVSYKSRESQETAGAQQHAKCDGPKINTTPPLHLLPLLGRQYQHYVGRFLAANPRASPVAQIAAEMLPFHVESLNTVLYQNQCKKGRCTYSYIYLYMHIYIYIYMYACVYIYLYMHIAISIYIYIHI